MEMTPVESSNLAAVGYEDGTMVVRFKNGNSYSYANVPAEVHAEFMASGSKGKHFNSQIQGRYTATKL